MKTFDEILIMQCYGSEDTFTVKECKQAVKEWLKQKLQQSLDTQQFYSSDESTESWELCQHWIDCINDLLKDIEKENPLNVNQNRNCVNESKKVEL